MTGRGRALRRLATLIIPTLSLAMVIAARLLMPGMDDREPFDPVWTLWFIAVILTSMFLGGALTLLWSPYWSGRRERIERWERISEAALGRHGRISALRRRRR